MGRPWALHQSAQRVEPARRAGPGAEEEARPLALAPQNTAAEMAGMAEQALVAAAAAEEVARAARAGTGNPEELALHRDLEITAAAVAAAGRTAVHRPLGLTVPGRPEGQAEAEAAAPAVALQTEGLEATEVAAAAGTVPLVAARLVGREARKSSGRRQVTARLLAQEEAAPEEEEAASAPAGAAGHLPGTEAAAEGLADR